MSNSDAGTDTGFQLRSKDEVECNDVVKYDDTGTLAGAKYHRWELGSVREDDALYITELLPGPASTHNIEQIRAALTRAPSENIFPQLPIPWFFERTGVTVHDSYDTEPDPAVYYLKRPWLAGYDAERAAAVNRPDQVAIWFAHEIKALEHLARCDPHPNIVRYHGCRMRRGRVTGIMLGRVPGDTIQNHLKAGKKIKNRRAFFKALTSAVTYLHDVVSLAHNDIQPTNVMVSPDGTTPTLIDFNSALPDGEEMMLCSMCVLFLFGSPKKKEN
ncbi:kinase-like domain-containing protein [Lasiosphaeria miniovina]|uniref:Kinase-like domain-containing protein n=1 Tax=Lasiosphaeria miniovina TaxID=1954250 RepID=A0AA40AK41_9PEZI|nr:kinase-like domain-containing protein [Lasiosphaeria miniovina]KAK0717298.1 kinase-like domain-containing protein [Lasiosphaeria miniovina]